MNRVAMNKGMTAKRSKLNGYIFLIIGLLAVAFGVKECVGAYISYNASDWTNKGIVEFKGLTISANASKGKYKINCISSEGYDYTENVDYDTYRKANSEHSYSAKHDVYTKKDSKDYYVAKGTNTDIKNVVWEMRIDKVGNNFTAFGLGAGFIIVAIYFIFSAKKTAKREQEVMMV